MNAKNAVIRTGATIASMLRKNPDRRMVAFEENASMRTRDDSVISSSPSTVCSGFTEGSDELDLDDDTDDSCKVEATLFAKDSVKALTESATLLINEQSKCREKTGKHNTIFSSWWS
jgi:hypothetical protein